MRQSSPQVRKSLVLCKEKTLRDKVGVIVIIDTKANCIATKERQKAERTSWNWALKTRPPKHGNFITFHCMQRVPEWIIVLRGSFQLSCYCQWATAGLTTYVNLTYQHTAIQSWAENIMVDDYHLHLPAYWPASIKLSMSKQGGQERKHKTGSVKVKVIKTSCRFFFFGGGVVWTLFGNSISIESLSDYWYDGQLRFDSQPSTITVFPLKTNLVGRVLVAIHKMTLGESPEDHVGQSLLSALSARSR